MTQHLRRHDDRRHEREGEAYSEVVLKEQPADRSTALPRAAIAERVAKAQKTLAAAKAEAREASDGKEGRLNG